MTVNTNRFAPHSDILALDFDGVIADSIGECLVAGHNAYVNYSGKGKMVRAIEALDSHEASEARRLRNFIRSGEDYVYIQMILDMNVEISDQEAYDAFINQHQDRRDAFLQAFYNIRETMTASDPDGWAALSPLYPGIKSFLQDYAVKDRLYIITTKKIEFVKIILDHNQISLIPENMFQGVPGLSKRQIIEQLLKKHQLSPSRFHFVDDQVDTLIKCMPTQAQLYLAEWGYNNEGQVAKGEDAGLEVIGLDSFIGIFNNG